MKKSIKIISIMMIAVIAMLSLAGCGSDEAQTLQATCLHI